MKLVRIEIENLRMYKRTLVIKDLAPGLNLFAGPNGSGKSTLVTAIRAAFLERHRSGTVDHLRPRDDGSASPSVEIEFTVGSTPFKLHKTFLGRKRCSLSMGSKQFDGEEAEDQLATIFGYGYAGRGASRDENWGIPGLLWIQQGAGHEVRDPVSFAGQHLQSALRSMVGSIASSEGDAVIHKLRTQREVLVTGGRSEPRGPYLAAKNELDSVEIELQDLDERIERYRGQVDQLGQLQADYAALESERPWIALGAQRDAAQEKLTKGESLSGEIAAEQQLKTDADGRVELFSGRLRELKEVEADLALATTKVGTAKENHDAAQLSSDREAGALDVAKKADRDAQAALTLARQVDRRARLTEQHDALATRLDRTEALLSQAAKVRLEVAANERAAAALNIDEEDLETLRGLASNLRDATVRLDAVGTRLGFELEEGVALDVGGNHMSGKSELLVVEPLVIALPGLGRLSISPGGEGVSELASRRADAEQTLGSALERIGVASDDAAELRFQDYRAASHQADVSRAKLAAIAPEGIASIEQDIEAVRLLLEEAAGHLANLPDAAANADEALPLQDVELAAQEASAAWQLASERRVELSEALRSTKDALAFAVEAQDKLVERVQSDDRQAQIKAADTALTEAQSAVRVATGKLTELTARVSSIDLAALRQDVARFKSSAEQELQRFDGLRDRLRVLRTEVQHHGADGLEERRALLQVKRVAQAARVSEFSRQVTVITHLLQMLEHRREAVQRQLLAPLQARVDHYIRLIFPEQRLVVGEQLVPDSMVTVDGQRNAGSFDEQSFGTREQLGLIARLAYADLLKEVGSPTLLILDDALVHSDSCRLSRIKRVIYDAAQRHQVLLMTCHPERWRDAGAPIRDMASLVAQSELSVDRVREAPIVS